jgi:phosphatidylserine decarboxylase
LARGIPALLWAGWCGASALIATTPRVRRRVGIASAVALSAAFFRDPERSCPEGGLLAPADGRVVAVDRLEDGRWRIATYMGLRNVHVNRSPADATIRSVKRWPGGHLPAFDKDSERNERVHWQLETANGQVELVQIAGALARRIVPYHAPGDRLQRGERIGLIRFGSRVDVTLPPGLMPGVAVGDRLRAGESRLVS